MWHNLVASLDTMDLDISECFSFFQTVQHNEYGSDRYAQEFGIKISDKLASVEARILPAPRVKREFIKYQLICELSNFYWYTSIALQLKYNDTGREKDVLPKIGQWNMMNKVIS